MGKINMLLINGKLNKLSILSYRRKGLPLTFAHLLNMYSKLPCATMALLA
jgi:hypothetical protein